MKIGLVLATGMAVLIANAGCGDDGGGGVAGSGGGGGKAGSSGGGDPCQKVAACGGEIIGDWKTSSVCVDPPKVSDVCESATATVSGTKISGTASFKADKTFSVSATIDATGMLTLPAACLKQGSQMLTCKQIQDVFTTDPTAKQLTCTDADDGCKCVNPYHEMVSSSGMYTTSANTVMLTSGMDKATADYCLKDGKLHLNITSSMGGLPTGQLSLGK